MYIANLLSKNTAVIYIEFATHSCLKIPLKVATIYRQNYLANLSYDTGNYTDKN